MSKALPSAQRVGGETSPVIFALIGMVVILLSVIVFMLVSGSLFDDQPSSVAERDYQVLLDGLAKYPDDPTVLMTLAEAEFDLGKNDDAIEHASRAWEFGSEMVGIPRRYAQMMMLVGDFEAAREGVEQEIALDTAGDNAEPLFLMAQIKRAEGDIEGALEVMEQALEISYMAADMRIIYAEILEEAGRTDDAIAEYEQALRYLPGDERATGALERLGVTVEETETVNPHDDGGVPTDSEGQ